MVVAETPRSSIARRPIGTNVFDAAVTRLASLYDAGHRLVVSFSGGKDSGVCLEIAIIAARLTGRLPVDVVTRDEEIMFPGTFEYVDRVQARPEVRLRCLVANQPIINVFNRPLPFYWVFDPLLRPDQWVRLPPPYAETITDLNIQKMTIPERFPPDPGKNLYAIVGLRTQESHGRMYGLFSSGGYITKPNRWGVRNARPIYDWTDADVWLAHQKFGWDYNRAYDTMHRLGIPRSRLRIAPPAMNGAGASVLRMASQAWPEWFEKVSVRLPGFRQGALFGKTAITPKRRLGETWAQTFERECLGPTVPDWIRDRAREWSRKMTSHHRAHATFPYPDVEPCHTCDGNQGSWKALTLTCWSGDPFSVRARGLPEVEPEFFRPGSGTWGGGKPTW